MVSFTQVACSGAKIHNIVGTIGEKQDAGDSGDFAWTDNQYRYDREQPNSIWMPGVSAQQDILTEKLFPDNQTRSAQDPEVITLGIGGNDIGFGDILAACVLPGTCDLAVPGSEDSVRQIAKIHRTSLDLLRRIDRLRVLRLAPVYMCTGIRT